jgi:tetratricopeptide (TPR) repeat protein
MYLALLVTETPASSWHVEGIQGRYFVYPFLFLSLAISEFIFERVTIKLILGHMLVIIMLFVSLASSIHTVINRYYLKQESWLNESAILNLSNHTMWNNYIKLNKTIALKYDNALAYNKIGAYFISSNEYSLADKNLKLALSIRPNYALVYTNLTRLNIKEENFAKALEYGSIALNLQNTPENLYNLGIIYKYYGDIIKSKSYLINAVNLRPKYFQAIVSLAELSLKEHDFNNALNLLNISYSITTTYSDFYYICSQYYYLNNNIKTAIDYAKYSLQIEPDRSEYKSMLEKLYNNTTITKSVK